MVAIGQFDSADVKLEPFRNRGIVVAHLGKRGWAGQPEAPDGVWVCGDTHRPAYVLPDGVGINYRLRRVNPTRFTLFLPAEFGDLGGQAAVVANLSARAQVRAVTPRLSAYVLVSRDERSFAGQVIVVG